MGSFSPGDRVRVVTEIGVGLNGKTGKVHSVQPGAFWSVTVQLDGDEAGSVVSFGEGELELLPGASADKDQFSTGAVRDASEGKPRPDFIDPNMLIRVGAFLEKNAREKYADFNFDKGIPSQRYMAGLQRHTLKYYAGWRDEDHLAAIIFNTMGLMSNEGTELDDLHEWRNNYSKEELEL